MKRLPVGSWERVVAIGTLQRAYRLARRGKKNRDEVARFGLDSERELFQLRDELEANAYRPGPYRLFTIYERKPRIIAAAPFRDRVVHHAAMQVVEPWFERQFIFDSYACRLGRGVHRAVDRYQQWARRYAYVLKLDVRRYFESISHAVLEAQLEHRIADPRILDLLALIIDNSPGVRPGRGIPIGNLTSQIFANVYLDGVDHFIKERLRVPAYLRYVDDLVLLGDDKARLWDSRDAIAGALAELGLELHAHKAQISRTTERVELLGYHVSRERRWLRNENGYRARRRIRALALSYARGRIELDEVRSRVMSWLGHAQHGETRALCNAMLGDIVFTRARPA
jgi:retron-type reverse transcriptase